MAKEVKPTTGTDAKNAKPEAPAAPVAKTSNLKTLLILGGGGLGLLGVTAAVTLMMLGGGKKHEAEEASKPQVSMTTNVTDKLPAIADSQALKPTASDAFDTAKALESVTKSIALLDVADSIAMADSANRIMQDSLAQVSWISKEKESLAKREQAVEAREKELAKLDRDVSQKLLKVTQEKSDRTTNLAKLYDGMDATAVANLMANLDDETVVAIIPRMKQKNASQVMALLPPQRAAKLSKQIITLANE